jgi:hypothetical protein
MRSLVVVATASGQAFNRFPKTSLTEALNLKDFLEQTGEYGTVAIYELVRSLGPLQQWVELEEGQT